MRFYFILKENKLEFILFFITQSENKVKSPLF